MMAGNGIKLDTKFGEHDEALWTFGFDWQEDNIRGNSFETTLAISIPLGEATSENKHSSKSKLARRMVEAPRRDIDIIVSESKAVKEVISEDSSISLKENDIIVLLGDDGEIDTGDMGTFELYQGHKLLSSGGYLKLNSAVSSSRSALFEPFGIQATLINSEANNKIILYD